jgi:hypothetical protein
MSEKQFPNDHKRVKKKLIAPMNHLFQERGWKVDFVEVCHERVLVPEIFWIAYLNDKLGSHKTSEIMIKIIRIANDINQIHSTKITGLASSFKRLGEPEQKVLLSRLEKEGVIDILNENIGGIKHLFEDFPLNFLITEPVIYNVGELQYLKNIITKLNDRLSKETTFTFAHLIYPLVSINFITVNLDSYILKTGYLLDYSITDESIRIASSLRSMSKLIDKEILTEDTFGWRKSFWKQCFKLEPCKI